MQILPLEKTFLSNVQYQAEHNKFYIFEYLGADNNVDYIEIEGRRTTPIDATLAPNHVTASNLFGQLPLDDQFVVVPPLHRFRFVSSASAKISVSGKLGIIEFGEGLPADAASRFRNMHLSYYRPVTISKTLAVNESIAAGAEVEVGSIIPSTIERYIFNNIAGVSLTNAGTITTGTLGLRIYYDDKPLDILDTGAGQFGIDVTKMPLPPTTTTNMEPFSFENMPLTVEPNHKLTFKIYNNSTSAITPPSGAAITITIKAIALYNIIG